MNQAIIDRVNSFGVEITAAANRYGLDVALLKGLVAQESRGNPLAYRPEPGYRWLWGIKPHQRPLRKPKDMPPETEIDGQKRSWGLCQIMGATAREHGFGAWYPKLCEPMAGVMWGARYLRWCMEHVGFDPVKALKKYNGSDDYPPKVLAWAELFKPKRGDL